MSARRVPDTSLSIGDDVFVAWSNAVRRGRIEGYAYGLPDTLRLSIQTEGGPRLHLEVGEVFTTARDACAAAFNVLDEARDEPMQLDMLRGRLRELVSLLQDAVNSLGPHIEGGDDEWLQFSRDAIDNARAVL